MVELSKERIGQILHEETVPNEEQKTILRSIYTRLMHLYERYFSDIDALNDNEIGKLSEYNKETESLVKYYYMDIPLDICLALEEFDKEYTSRLLGEGWHDFLYNNYEDYRESNDKEKEDCKAEFSKHTLDGFYEAMSYIFREAFETDSKNLEEISSGLSGFLFGK